MENIIVITVITGASSGFGTLAARALARAGHTVYASMRETTGRNAPQVKEVEKYAAEHGVDLRAIELDVSLQESGELAHWGIEISIIVPGAFTSGTNHFTHAGSPNDQARADEYASGADAGLAEEIHKGLRH